MWRGVRCTLKRASPSSRMRLRVFTARRRRRSFLLRFMVSASLLLLAFLERDLLVRVAHALTLVGLRRTDTANLSTHLPDLLPVDSLHDDLGRARCLDRDAFRDRKV